MVNYNPVVQSIVGMGKVEEPEYVDTRINVDLSSLGKLAEQQTQGLMEAARFEREMYSAIDKANRQKKADQYAALKEQRAAEKHQWAAEKHQFAINAEDRAQTKFNIEQAQKGLLLNFANEATELARSAEYTGASIYERNAQLTKLMDKYTPAGIDPVQMTKVANNLFGNIGADLNQIMVNRENRLNESEEKAAERFVDSGDFPEESKVLMSTRDKLNLWNNTRNVQGNLQSAIGMLDSIKENGVDPNLAIDTFKKAGGEATKLAAYMSVAQQMQANPIPMTPEQKEQARMWYTNMLIEQSGGTLSRGEARAVVNANTTFFDLPLDVQKNLIKSIGQESTIKIAGSGEALSAMYYLNGEKGVQEALLQSGLPGMELISNLGSNLGKASNGTITMPDGSTQTVNYFTQGWWNSLNTQQQQQLAPLVANMATNGNNTPDTRTSTTGVIISEAGKIIDNLVTRDTSDLQNAINDEDISKVNVGGNIDAALSFIDKNEETWKKASTVSQRDMTGQIQYLAYKTISLAANSLSEYGFGTYIVYDPETNQLYPTKDMTNVSTLDAIARTGGQAWRMEIIDQANEMLKRVNRFSIDEKETKAFIKDTLADNSIEVYDKNKHVIENPNYITKLWRGVGRAIPDTVNTGRTLITAVKELAQNGKVSEATSAQLYADYRKLYNTGENFEKFIKDQVEQSVEGGLEIKDGVVSLINAISETDTFKQYSKILGENYEKVKENFLNLFGGDVEETEAAEDSFVEPTVEQQQQRQEQLEEISDTTEETMPWDERISSPEEVKSDLESRGIKYFENKNMSENGPIELLEDTSLPANPWTKTSKEYNEKKKVWEKWIQNHNEEDLYKLPIQKQLEYYEVMNTDTPDNLLEEISLGETDRSKEYKRFLNEEDFGDQYISAFRKETAEEGDKVSLKDIEYSKDILEELQTYLNRYSWADPVLNWIEGREELNEKDKSFIKNLSIDKNEDLRKFIKWWKDNKLKVHWRTARFKNK